MVHRVSAILFPALPNTNSYELALIHHSYNFIPNNDQQGESFLHNFLVCASITMLQG